MFTSREDDCEAPTLFRLRQGVAFTLSGGLPRSISASFRESPWSIRSLDIAEGSCSTGVAMATAGLESQGAPAPSPTLPGWWPGAGGCWKGAAPRKPPLAWAHSSLYAGCLGGLTRLDQ